MTIVFQGLCGFAKRARNGFDFAEISILKGGHHPHSGLLIAKAEEVDPKKTTWNPKRIFSTPAGDVYLEWEISGLQVDVDTGATAVSTYWDSDEVLNLTHHKNTKAKTAPRGVFSVYGGTFTAKTSKYAETLEHVTGDEPAKVIKTRKFADRIEWTGAATSDIVAPLEGRIVFHSKIASPEVSVCNEAAIAGNGLSHFECYYDLFDIESTDRQTTVRPAAPGAYVALGWNCIDPAEVP